MTEHRWLPILLMLFILSVVLPPSAAPQPETQAPSEDVDCQKHPAPLPVITRVLVNWGHGPKRIAWPPQGPQNQVALAFLGQRFTLKGCNFDQFESNASSTNPLQIFLDGMPLVDVKPAWIRKGGKVTGVGFEFLRTEKSKETWVALLGRPQTKYTEVDVSLGLAKNISDPVQIHLVAIRTHRLWLFIGFLLLLLGVIVRLAAKQPILRDRGQDSPWSLARTQMAWWTFFVVGGFLFIWIVTGSYSSLSPSVLALIGISSGTALLGAVMDDTKETQRQKRETLEKEKQDLQARQGSLRAEEQARLQEIDLQLKELSPVEEQRCKGNILLDILSDEDGVSFHRLQMIIWTVALTAIFVVRVYATLSMPDFDTQLLGLTGISAGTYLGFKFPEKAS